MWMREEVLTCTTHSLYRPPAISSQTLGVVFCALGHAGSSSFSPCDESQLETVFH